LKAGPAQVLSAGGDGGQYEQQQLQQQQAAALLAHQYTQQMATPGAGAATAAMQLNPDQHQHQLVQLQQQQQQQQQAFAQQQHLAQQQQQQMVAAQWQQNQQLSPTDTSAGDITGGVGALGGAAASAAVGAAVVESKPKVKQSRPWKCITCSRSFVHKASLIKHNVELHGLTDTSQLVPRVPKVESEATGRNYKGQAKEVPFDPMDDQIFPVIIDGTVHHLKGSERLVVQSKYGEKRKLAGTAAPRVKNIDRWQVDHPDFEIVLSGKKYKRQKKAKPVVAPSTHGTRGAATAANTRHVPKLMWALDGLEEGIASVYVKEVQAHNNSAHTLLAAGEWGEAKEMYLQGIAMAEKALHTVQMAHDEFAMLPTLNA
jgi:hypothetical protein